MSTTTSLATALHCPAPIAEILCARGIADLIAASLFLQPSIEGFLTNPEHDPNRLRGMDVAVTRLLSALHRDEPILIYGDYDVDGTSAVVLLKTALERIAAALNPPRTADIRFHVPHRIREGYGMRSTVLARAASEGVRLVISVDTGIRAFEEADQALALGLDLIVTDHHLPDDYKHPNCLAVINPTQPGCDYPNKHLCGAAVAFKVAHALLLAAAPLTGNPESFTQRVERVLIPSFLKIVAIATVADAVPLTGENRMIAALGLAALANPVQPGLRALMECAKLPLDCAPTASEVAFRLAPRINAAGRMEVASDVVELFLTRDPERAKALAKKLDDLNQQRKDSESAALATIEQRLYELLDEQGEYPAECLVLDNPDWHRGVLGILASRVVEYTHRPALVISHADGEAHGSGRSIPGFHLLHALINAEEADPEEPLFQRFGGHEHAVGFSLPADRLEQLRARLGVYSDRCLTPDSLLPTRAYDAEIAIEDLTPQMFEWIQRLAPFGHGNPEPVFLLRQARLASAPRILKERHIRLDLSTGTRRDSPAIAALGWSRRSCGEGIPDATSWAFRCAGLGLEAGSCVDLLVRLRRDSGPYANARIGGLELEIDDLRLADA